MSNIVRTAKSGSDWNKNDLRAYNIRIHNEEEIGFFGSNLNMNIIDDYEDLANFNFDEDKYSVLPKETRKVLSYLDMVHRSNTESIVDIFASSLLRSMDYDTDDRLVLERIPIKLLMCGSDTTAGTDICIFNKNTNTLLLLQEDKRFDNSKDPEPQVIAEAIAAFQENNKKRSDRRLEPLEEMIFPCITMVGTFPRFYLVPVTKELSDCVEIGIYPNNPTVVLKHVPNIPGNINDGMRPVGNRKKILQCFEAFKRSVNELEEILE